MKWLLFFAGFLIQICVLPSLLVAQTAITIEAQRDQVFSQMLRSPSDRGLMARYVELSLQIRDYEAAAATMERLLDLEPKNQNLRLELAATYLWLGSNILAQYHLAAVKRLGQLDPQTAAAMANIEVTADDRSQPTRFNGSLAFGAGQTGSSSPINFQTELGFSVRYDWGGPHDEDWLTQGNVRLQGGNGGQQSWRVRSGPEFRIQGTVYGPRLQPYLQYVGLRDDAASQSEVGVGLYYENPITAYLSTFADVDTARRKESGSSDLARKSSGVIGITLYPLETTQIRFSVNHQDSQKLSAEERVTGFRVDARYEFDVGQLNSSRDWVVGGYLSKRFGSESNDTNSASYIEDGYGIWLRAFMTDDSYLETRLSQLLTDTSTGSSVARNNQFSVLLGWEF